MSAEYKTLAEIRVVTDHDCGNYELGEISGAVDASEIADHIRQHGAGGIRRALCHLLYIVEDEARTVNGERSETGCCAADTGGTS